MILLRLVSWPYLRKHVLRTALTVAGIVLGVAVFVGMRAANQSVLSAFDHTVDRIAGKTELQVTAGETGFSEDVLERVQGARSVRVAVPVVEAVVDSKLRGQGSLLVLGVDMTGDRSLRDYELDAGDEAVIDDPLVFLAQPDSLIVSREFADKNGFGVNSRVSLGTALGQRQFTVRGVMKSSGLTSAFGGNLAIMDVYAAQRMFGRGRTFDRVDLAVAEGWSIAAARDELRQLLGPGLQVDSPAGRGRQFEAMTRAYSMMVNVSSSFAMFIGMFIIYNSFSTAVTQRRSEIGVLRAIGATRRQIRSLFLTESAITGLVGSLGGVVFGLAIARGIAASIGQLISDVYGVAQRTDEVATNPQLLALAVVVGVATSMVAAFVPAHQASHVDPIHAIQKGKYQALAGGGSRLRAAAALAFVVVSLACLLVSGSRVVFYAGYACAIVAVVLLTPLMVQLLARGLRPVLRAIRPVEGALAADSLIQAPRRTSASVAALMLSLALVVAFAGMARASYASIIDWMETSLNPDLFVLPSQDIVVRTLRFPEAMEGELAGMSGIRRVQAVRNARIIFRGTPVMIVAVDIASVVDTARLKPVSGDEDTMFAEAAAGRGVLVSDNLAQLQRLGLGQEVEVAAPYGILRLPIVGVVVDYSDQQGTIMIDRTVFKQVWHDDTVNALRVYLAPGAEVPVVRQQILERYAGERQVFVLTNLDLKAYILKITDHWFGLTSVQIAVAVLVAILGIVNSLTVSITDRRRELGVLRAVGAGRGQVRRTIWMEALSVALLGLALGLGFGAVNLYYILEMVQRDFAGMRLDYAFPFSVAALLVPTMLGAAFVAAVWPAESAVRASLVEALEYE